MPAPSVTILWAKGPSWTPPKFSDKALLNAEVEKCAGILAKRCMAVTIASLAGGRFFKDIVQRTYSSGNGIDGKMITAAKSMSMEEKSAIILDAIKSSDVLTPDPSRKGALIYNKKAGSDKGRTRKKKRNQRWRQLRRK